MEDKNKTAMENITPHFYNISKDGRGKLKEAESKAATSVGNVGSSVAGAASSGKNILGSNFVSNISGKASANETGKGKGMIKGFAKAGAGIAIIIVLFVSMIGVFMTPRFLIGNIDYNLQRVLGFGDTVAVLEKQAEYVTATALKEGKVRDDYAVDLESNGLLVGQIAANGEFVRTNTYIADLGVPKEIASTGAVYGDEALNITLGKQEDGQLVMKYGSEIVNGDNFVAKVESDPKMYFAYSNALNIASRYYYSDEVTTYYSTYGLSRNSFASWEPTGNKQTDDESFSEILNKVLDNSDAVGTDGLDMGWYNKCGRVQKIKADCRITVKYLSVPEDQLDSAAELAVEECESSGEYDECERNGRSIIGIYKNNSLEESVSGFGGAEDLTSAVSSGTMIEGDAELSKEKAVSLLNVAMSSNEPYTATKAFLAVEESINRARAGDEGPVNQVMDMLAKKTEAKVTDPKTGETVVTNESIFNTRNFAVAASDGGPYSREEASMYSRDNIVNTMNNVGGVDIGTERLNNTAVSTSTSKRANTLMTMSHEGENAGDLVAINNTINNTFYNDMKEIFSSTVGGNRVPAGGSFLSNSINQYSIGSLPSDTAQMVAYNNVVQEVLARKAEAERSSLSPFDISSSNTLFGRIAHDFASSMIRNYGSNDNAGILNVVSSVADYAGSSIAKVTSGAYAAAEEEFTMINGDCPTPNSAAETNGDLYCNSHNTTYTGYMDYTEDDYRGTVIGESFDEDGRIKSDSPVAEIVALGTGRASIVGNANSDICERYKDMHRNGFQKVMKSFKDFIGLNNYVEQYERCGSDDAADEGSGIIDAFLDALSTIIDGKEVPQGVATGARYTLSDGDTGEEIIPGTSNKEVMELYSAYSMYEMVSSMLTDNENEVTAFKERYYAEHPLDNSAAGIVARRSGMTKKEAQIALNYADYLNAIANYNPAERMKFGVVTLNLGDEKNDLLPIELKEDKKFSEKNALVVASRNGLIARRENEITV